MNIPAIPNEYLVLCLIASLVAMRFYGIDSFTTAGIGLLIGYVTGKHIEQTKGVV